MATKMKKALAITLVLLQLVAVFAFNASAAVTPAAQTVYRVDPNDIRLDDGGVSATEPWDKVGAIPMYTFKNVLVEDATLKALWANDGSKTYVYMLLNFIDSDEEQSNQSTGCTWNDGDGFQLAVDETGTANGAVNGWSASATVYRTGTKSASVRTTKENNVSYAVSRANDHVTVEAVFTLNNSAIKEGAVIGINAFGQLRTATAGSPIQFTCNAQNINVSAETFVKSTLSGIYAEDIFIPQVDGDTAVGAPKLLGAQMRKNEAEDTYDIRFVALIESKDYKQIGFNLDLTYSFYQDVGSGNGYDLQAQKQTGAYDAKVDTVYKYLKYTAVDGEERAYYAGEGAYFAAFTLEGVPLSSDVAQAYDELFGTVSVYGVTEEGTYTGSVYVFGASGRNGFCGLSQQTES